MDIRETSSLKVSSPRHFWEKARIHFIQRIIRKYHPQIRTLADIGCGDCAVISALMQNRPETRIFGVDQAFTPEMIRTIQQQIGNPNVVLTTDLEPLDREQPDLILMMDVIEHLEKPGEMLQQLQHHTAAGGVLIATVPAFQYLYSDHDRFLKHFRRYNGRELRRLLTENGWQVEVSGYFFASLLPIRLVQKFLHASAAKEEALKVGNHFFNTLAAWFLMADAEISFLCSRLGIPLPGLSCFAVTRKKD